MVFLSTPPAGFIVLFVWHYAISSVSSPDSGSSSSSSASSRNSVSGSSSSSSAYSSKFSSSDSSSTAFSASLSSSTSSSSLVSSASSSRPTSTVSSGCSSSFHLASTSSTAFSMMRMMKSFCLTPSFVTAHLTLWNNSSVTCTANVLFSMLSSPLFSSLLKCSSITCRINICVLVSFLRSRLVPSHVIPPGSFRICSSSLP
ncbi:hypothetical protein EVA_03467 [gut metagenome]|uniref:Uncharacterized protein n=1 Tax=gut metagenome TaxID=749906 RepID=J9GYW3_9ZZZZ